MELWKHKRQHLLILQWSLISRSCVLQHVGQNSDPGLLLFILYFSEFRRKPNSIWYIFLIFKTMLIQIVKMAALRWVACQWVFSPNVTALQRNTCKLACVVQIEMFFCFLLHLVIAHIIYVLKCDDLYLCMFFVLGTSKDKHQKHNDMHHYSFYCFKKLLDHFTPIMFNFHLS